MNSSGRTYTKAKRAENEAATRQRIVEAALALHAEVGPSATTISMIADRAGVQRHTVYAHLPDDRSVLMACSGLHAEREPLPSPGQWSDLNDPESRIRAALTALYEWFSRNEALLARVLADVEGNATLQEVSTLRFATPLGAIEASLEDGLAPRQRAALAVALSFYTWRTLARTVGLGNNDAVEVMLDAIQATGT